MKHREAKEELEMKIVEMEKIGSKISYAAIVIDDDDPTNCLLEYGVSDYGPFIKEDNVDPRQKETYLSDNKVRVMDKDLARQIYNKITTNCCNLLSTNNVMKERVRPIKGAISIADVRSEKKSGTIGCLFRVKEHKDVVFLLSNMHVLSYFEEFGNRKREQVSANHDYVVQPSRSDAADLGYDDDLGELKIGKTVWKLFDGIIDAAVAKLDKKIDSSEGLFNGAYNHRGSYESTIKIGDNTHKYGRTTGFTESKILSTEAAVKVKNFYPSSNHGNEFIVFRDQIMTNDMAEDGDSGSLLVGTDHKYPIGLTFADINFESGKGRTFHNKLSNVFMALENKTKLNSNNEQLTFKSFIV